MTLRDATPIPCSAFRLLCTDRDRTPLEDNRPCAKTEAHCQQREGSFSANISCNYTNNYIISCKYIYSINSVLEVKVTSI